MYIDIVCILDRSDHLLELPLEVKPPCITLHEIVFQIDGETLSHSVTTVLFFRTCQSSRRALIWHPMVYRRDLVNRKCQQKHLQGVIHLDARASSKVKAFHLIF